MLPLRAISEPPRETAVAAEADVVVAGGGPAGLAAAVAAAREGARTLLIERYGFLGGLATAGLVAPILGHTASQSETPIVEGLLRTLTERMHSLGGSPSWQESLGEWGIRFDAEALKYAADQMVAEQVVDLILHTLVTDVLVEGDRLRGLAVEGKSGRQAVLAKVVVDATGDGDVAARAGVPYTLGRRLDGAVMAMGSFFYLAGIPELPPEEAARARELVEESIAAGELSFYHGGFAGHNTYHRDFYSPNMTRLSGDPTNTRDLTAAETKARRDVWQFLDFLCRNVPGCENAYVLATSPQVGVRESRQVAGRYTLSGDDVAHGRRFDDGIARGSWWIDIHCPMGHTYPVHLCERECPRGERCAFWAAEHEHLRRHEELFPPQGGWYDIPYRCLLPLHGPANLLVAGRCLSATPEAMAGARVMGTCMAIGEAAGIAAAMAAATGGVVADVDPVSLRTRLVERGALV